MQGSKMEFSDIVSSEKLIERLKKTGNVLVRFTFHHSANNATRKSIHCSQNATLLRLAGSVRALFKLPEAEGIFFYINKKIPDMNKPLKDILELLQNGEILSIDVATEQMF